MLSIADRLMTQHTGLEMLLSANGSGHVTLGLDGTLERMSDEACVS